jgi:hypothetical protein
MSLLRKYKINEREANKKTLREQQKRELSDLVSNIIALTMGVVSIGLSSLDIS